MKLLSSAARIAIPLVCLLGLALAPSTRAADRRYVVKPVAEMKVKQLPKGPLYWRVEEFPSLEQAKAAAAKSGWDPDTVRYRGAPALTAEVAGKAWLFTLGPRGPAAPGGKQVAEIGPLPPLAAPEYLLRINYGGGPPGAETPVHSHSGSESFYVVAGKLGQRTPQGTSYAEAGHSMNGHQAGTTMQVFNAGTTELTALIMFVADATKPFSAPGKFQ